jgi:hypothetical protein
MRLTKVDIAGLIVVGLLLVWQDARAADLVLHVGSNHFGTDAQEYDFNERNLGVGVKYDLTRGLALRGGVYDNSYNRGSVYLGGDVHTNNRMVNAGVQAGVVSGYDGTPQGAGSVTAYFLPYVSVGTRTVKAEVGCLPPLVGGIGVLTLSVSVRVW